MANTSAASIHQFELEIAIDAGRDRVWQALTDEIDAWWLPDFRAAGEGSVVSGLVWYTVQMTQPGEALYPIGHTAPDWGGPKISMLKLWLEARGNGLKKYVEADGAS